MFSSRQIVGDERKQEVLDECIREERPFLCHKGSIHGEYIVCRGFYDTYDLLVFQLARVLNRVDFREVPK